MSTLNIFKKYIVPYIYSPSHTYLHTILILILLSLIPRLYGISYPLTDAGHERQTQVAMIARNFNKDRLGILYPRMSIFAPFPGYVALEFPLQPYLMSLFYRYFWEDDRIGRLISLFFSVGGIIFFYQILLHIFKPDEAFWGALIYSLSPMNIFFGRAVFPEAVLMFFCLGSFAFFLNYCAQFSSIFFLFSSLFFAVACIVKTPPAIIYLFPLIYLLYRVNYKENYLKKFIRISAFFIPTVILVIAWVFWARSLVDSNINKDWNPYQLSALKRWGIPDFWFKRDLYLLLSKSLITVGLTPIPAVLAVLGIYNAKFHKDKFLVYIWLISTLIYVIGTPGAQATHWNYHVPLLPIGFVLAIIGSKIEWKGIYIWVQNSSPSFFKKRSACLAFFLIVLSLYCVLYYKIISAAYAVDIRTPYAREFGDIVDRSIPKYGYVLLYQPNMVPTTQSYYMNREVRSISDEENILQTIKELIRQVEQGANALAVVNTPYGNSIEMFKKNSVIYEYIKDHWHIQIETNDYILFNFPVIDCTL